MRQFPSYEMRGNAFDESWNLIVAKDSRNSKSYEFLPSKEQKSGKFQAETFNDYYTLYSLSVFLSAKSQELILEINAAYKLVIYVLADYWLICRLRAMRDFQEQCQTVLHAMLCLSLFSSKQFILRQLLDSVFLIFRNNQGLCKC